MHRAIREGKKTVTRRLHNLKEINQEPANWGMPKKLEIEGISNWYLTPTYPEITGTLGIYVKPRYHVGEVVYLKEAWYIGRIISRDEADVFFGNKLEYITVPWNDWLEQQYINDSWDESRSPLFMPAWAARDFVQILSVRPGRLQEITSEDCYAEGVSFRGDSVQKPKDAYRDLWNSINPKFLFESNPWNWRIEFKLVPRPEGL